MNIPFPANILLLMKKVDEAVKQGVRNIPGIKVYEKEEITMRVKN